MLGLPKTGKSLVAKALYENHKRKLSVIDEIVDDLVELTSQENPACSRNNLTWGQGEAVFGRETDAEWDWEGWEKKAKRVKGKEEEVFKETYYLPSTVRRSLGRSLQGRRV